MEPMSLHARRLFAFATFLLFIVVLPIVVLYASGYRLNGFSLVSTGGIHFSTPLAGTSIYLNGEETERSSIFSKSFFFDNLSPGSYVIQTAIDGYVPWSKTVIVESRLVTDVSMLAVPQPVRVLALHIETATSTNSTSATSTLRFIPKDQYTALGEVFAATTTPQKTTATTSEETPDISIDSHNGLALYVVEGDLRIGWKRSTQPPSSFCSRPSNCLNAFFLEQGGDTVVHAVFFGGGVVYRTKESGIFFAEADIRQPRLLTNIYTKPNAEFAIINGAFYIKDGSMLYEVVWP